MLDSELNTVPAVLNAQSTFAMEETVYPNTAADHNSPSPLNQGLDASELASSSPFFDFTGFDSEATGSLQLATGSIPNYLNQLTLPLPSSSGGTSKIVEQFCPNDRLVASAAEGTNRSTQSSTLTSLPSTRPANQDAQIATSWN